MLTSTSKSMNSNYRTLTSSEISQLESQGNYAEDWSTVHVAQVFCVQCVRNSTFEGAVYIGNVEDCRHTDGALTLREGIYGSYLRDATVGNHPAVHNVRMLSRYTIGDNVQLFNIDEMCADPDNLAWMEPMNENGGRKILPFGGMTIGDAYLWARYRGRKRLMEKLEQFTTALLATDEGRYGRVGDGCVVKNTQSLHNVIIQSTEEDRTVIDSCITLRDGVVGYGCTLEHGVIAVRFLLGEHVHLEFGLRLNDTVVGDNSTLARCEVGNSIIFPAHEQHHNNSFLIAGLVMGQSNIAAGCTIGSNHNSRTADNELVGGRGFWPGLCCSFKHSSRFASYCMIAKGDYPSELDIKLPFALVNNNVSSDQLEVMPAYWWMYNMYAMDRNSKKFAKRDKRRYKAQNIEFDNLAPDTAEEILRGIELLRKWKSENEEWRVEGGVMEKSKRPVVILKGEQGIRAYEEMLIFYAMKTLESGGWKAESVEREKEWINLGGQLVAKADMEQLIADVENGIIGSWQAINERLDMLWGDYPAKRAAHAYAILCALAGVERLDDAQWGQYRQRYVEIQKYIEEQKVASRKKDDVNPFRRMTYWDDEEMAAVL